MKPLEVRIHNNQTDVFTHRVWHLTFDPHHSRSFAERGYINCLTDEEALEVANELAETARIIQTEIGGEYEQE